MQSNILFPFGKSIEISIKIEERVLRCAGMCFIKNSTVKYSRDMNSGYVIITEYFKTLKIFCQIDTRKIFLLSSSPVPHFSLPTKIRTTNQGDSSCVHNSDLSDIRVYTNCFSICGVSGITADKARSFFQPSFYQMKSPPLTPHTLICGVIDSVYTHESL